MKAPSDIEIENRQSATELYEWLSSMRLASPHWLAHVQHM